MRQQQYHEKLGLAAFVLSLVGVATAGLLVIPSMICALMSKRHAEAMGLPRDGYATAAMVVCISVLGMWGLLFATGSLVVLSGLRISEDGLRVILAVGGLLLTGVAVRQIVKHTAGAKRMRRLAGLR
ncbi:hypothetical protein KBB96_17985 [Luteolibacter ambystomatis]|uniref:DUF4190 domain-containing protein n=1 Tax=Luteolibacter ambystomatis TaxID=2824561 RepID=A0A975G8G9_9BACT|nr:hypothetical protein [Luteolibacter ambystomatis]QUE50738.1 hypothetical protein KBB96_17985 [Luteolibacter ambystomatis]